MRSAAFARSAQAVREARQPEAVLGESSAAEKLLQRARRPAYVVGTHEGLEAPALVRALRQQLNTGFAVVVVKRIDPVVGIRATHARASAGCVWPLGDAQADCGGGGVGWASWRRLAALRGAWPGLMMSNGCDCLDAWLWCVVLQVLDILGNHVKAGMAVVREARVDDVAGALGYMGDALSMHWVDVPRDGHCGAHAVQLFRKLLDDSVSRGRGCARQHGSRGAAARAAGWARHQSFRNCPGACMHACLTRTCARVRVWRRAGGVAGRPCREAPH
jgi:hypothetical protein